MKEYTYKAKTNIPAMVSRRYGIEISNNTYIGLSFAEKQFYYEVEEESDLYSNNISCEY